MIIRKMEKIDGTETYDKFERIEGHALRINYMKPLLGLKFEIECSADELYWLMEDPKMGLRRKFNRNFEESFGFYIRTTLM